MRYISLMALSASFASALQPRQSTPQQVTVPSNLSSDLAPVATSPRFLLNGTEFPDLPPTSLAPLGPYIDLTKSQFERVNTSAQLINVNVANSNNIASDQWAYISCDPEDYSGYLGASNALANAFNSPDPNIIIILYSKRSNHCNISNLDNAPVVNGVLTTVNPTAASALAKLNLNSNSRGQATILPDPSSYTNVTGGDGFGDNNLLGPSPTTAVAMIILYSITGIITSLFVVIIITGAIRAHRHPERYGPRAITGRTRQSRAKGIARAMLETLPIVKFGDHEDLPPKVADGTIPQPGRDVEMHSTTTNPTATATEKSTVATEDLAGTVALDSTRAAAHDGTSDEGTLGCSICTEDFTKGEEVRVLPCNHKFHPDCVDPWLLNVSGTCPLCRIDLRPEEERTEAPTFNPADHPAGEGTLNLPPPLTFGGESNGRRGTVSALRGVASGTREERIAALRRYRQERRRSTMALQPEGTSERQGERGSLSARLRERFRIRTTPVGDGEGRTSGTNAEAGIGTRTRGTLRRASDGLERLQRAI